jgi:hypothetical protein
MVNPEMHALVADEHTVRPSDQVLDFIFGPTAERALLFACWELCH